MPAPTVDDPRGPAVPPALLALPVFWRPWNWRLPLAVATVIVVAYLPYLSVGSGEQYALVEGDEREVRAIADRLASSLRLARLEPEHGPLH